MVSGPVRCLGLVSFPTPVQHAAGCARVLTSARLLWGLGPLKALRRRLGQLETRRAGLSRCGALET